MTDGPIMDAFDDGFGPEMTADELRADLVARLPALLRSRCCSPEEPWVGVDGHDHGHTDCLFMNEAADEIERLRKRLFWADLLAEQFLENNPTTKPLRDRMRGST